MSERMRSPFSITAITEQAEYVSLLGTVQDKDASYLETTMTFTGVTVTTDESIFVGIGVNANAGNFPGGITVTDNLGNTYVEVQGMQGTLGAGIYMGTGLFAAIPTVAGTISQIDITLTEGAYVAAVAGRFRNIGAAISSTAEVAEGADYSAPNAVLTQAGPAQGIGISCFADRSTGSVTFSPGTLVGYDSTSGGADSSNIIAGLGYASPVTGSGIVAQLSADPTRPFVHVGKQYGGYNPWP